MKHPLHTGIRAYGCLASKGVTARHFASKRQDVDCPECMANLAEAVLANDWDQETQDHHVEATRGTPRLVSRHANFARRKS